MNLSVKFLARNNFSRGGFTLSELLVGLTIIAILSSAVITSLAGIGGSANMTDASEQIQGVLNQARAQALAGSTYVWVGFFEEDPTAAATTPQVAGKGRLVLAVMASNDGTNLQTHLVPNGSSFQLPGTSLGQVTRLVKIPNVHVDTSISGSGAVTFPDTAGTVTPYEVDPTASNTSSTTANFPATGTAKYTFSQIIQFNPQGDASEIYTSPTQAIDIGLRAAHGNQASGNNSKNVVVIRLEGIGGKVTIYRP